MSVGQQKPGNPNQDQPTSPRQGAAEPPPDLGALKEDVTEAAEAALERGRQFVDSAREQATGFLDQRKNDAAQSVADVAHALREACKAFDDRQNIRAFVDSAASGLDQLADTIRSRSYPEIYSDVEDILRRRPGAVAATTLAAGFLISRFIKASADNVREAEAQRRRQAGGVRGQRSGARSTTVRV
jgi:hypothetical protein